MADKLRTQQQLEALQNRYVGTGHADTTAHEFKVNGMRDYYSSMAGHPALLSYTALGMGEPREKVRLQMIHKMGVVETSSQSAQERELQRQTLITPATRQSTALASRTEYPEYSDYSVASSLMERPAEAHVTSEKRGYLQPLSQLHKPNQSSEATAADGMVYNFGEISQPETQGNISNQTSKPTFVYAGSDIH